MRCAVASLYHRAERVLVSYAHGYPERRHLCAKHFESEAAELSTNGVTHFGFLLTAAAEPADSSRRGLTLQAPAAFSNTVAG